MAGRWINTAFKKNVARCLTFTVKGKSKAQLKLTEQRTNLSDISDNFGVQICDIDSTA